MRFAATRSVLRKAVIWGLVGLGVAIFFLLASTFTHALSSLQLIFWPTSLAFMALDNATTTRTEWVEGAAFLAFTNFALYFLVGLILTCLWRAGSRLASRGASAR